MVGPKYPATIQLCRDYLDERVSVSPTAVYNPFVLTENINNTNYRVNDLYYTDNLGRIFNTYFEEQNVPEGYTLYQVKWCRVLWTVFMCFP